MATETESTVTVLDPDQLWWVCWRIKGDLCGRTLYPCKTVEAANIAEKAGAVYGKENVWLERDGCGD